ncbi:MAG: hypothetical protein KDB27_12655, partial [Planctomycetales bacterium]|nr:hypothetical protein [Planctomycetales bacterium]
ALQMYHAYAEEQLAAACGYESTASEILVGLAKLQPLLVSQDSEVSSLALPRSMSLFQTALLVDSKNYLAANELGVLFAKYGQLSDARDIFTHCVEIDPTQAVAWKNLASVHDKLGEKHLAQAAMDEFQMASNRQQSANANPPVVWVDPSTFSANQTVAVHAQTTPPQQNVPSQHSFAAQPNEQARLGNDPTSAFAIHQDQPPHRGWTSRITSLFKSKPQPVDR